MSTYAYNLISSKELSQTLRHMRIGIPYNDALNELSAWWPPHKRGLPPFATYKIKLFRLHSWVYESQSEWKRQWQDKIWKVGYLQIPILDKISKSLLGHIHPFCPLGVKEHNKSYKSTRDQSDMISRSATASMSYYPLQRQADFRQGKKKKKNYFFFRKVCSYFSLYARDKLGVLSGLPSWHFLCQLSQIWHIVKWLAVKKSLVGLSA